MLTLASEPGGFERTVIADNAWIDPNGLGVNITPYLHADARR